MNVVAAGDCWFHFEAENPAQTHPRLLRRLDALGHSVLALSEVPRSLETLYLRILEQVE